jgi:hypothetical protein
MNVTQIRQGQQLLRLRDNVSFQVTGNPIIAAKAEQLQAAFHGKRTALGGLAGLLPKSVGVPLANLLGWAPQEEKLVTRLAMGKTQVTTDEFSLQLPDNK